MAGVRTELLHDALLDIRVFQIPSGITFLFGKIAKEDTFDVVIRDVFRFNYVFLMKQSLNGLKTLLAFVFIFTVQDISEALEVVLNKFGWFVGDWFPGAALGPVSRFFSSSPKFLTAP